MSAAKVRCQLAVLHEAASHCIARMDALLASGVLSGAFGVRASARLSMLCAFARAWRARVMARLAAHGRPLVLMPAPVTEVGTPEQELQHLAQLCEVLAERYAKAAQLARDSADLSTAWVCELNRVEAENVALELRGLLEPQRRVGT